MKTIFDNQLIQPLASGGKTMSASSSDNSISVLPAWGIRSVSIQGFLLVCASFLLPALAHLTGLPVRYLLPMHWPVLLVGLCYGWRSGLLAGLAAPGLSHLISGMPLPHILPAMTIELGVYGFLSGLLRQKFHLGQTLSTSLALIGGRIVFLAVVLLTAAVPESFDVYLYAAMLPGLVAAVVQILVLPPVARALVNNEYKR